MIIALQHNLMFQLPVFSLNACTGSQKLR